MAFEIKSRPARRLTREVKIGEVTIGGLNPVVVQSMTTTPTTDTKGTVDQIEKLIDVGCPIIRVTTPTMADVETLASIRAEMKRRGLRAPLVADVHFLPQVALKACEFVEKVRINPGNFADRKRFEVLEYTDAEYQEELDRIRESFTPVVRRAKELGVALRIGTNHGSLSDRIMNRYGDSPLGMVESALEFVRIAQDENFHEIVLSMKSSNVQVMIQTYRLLVSRMNELKMDYPLHLGVTEAGDGEDGRIKSAIGIASLLSDGIGDTIRVSLTEDPEKEIPVAQQLVKLFARPLEIPTESKTIPISWDPFVYQRRDTTHLSTSVTPLGGKEIVRVRTSVKENELDQFIFSQRNYEPPVESVCFDVTKKLFKTNALASVGKMISVVLRLQEQNPSDLQKENLPFHALSIRPGSAWTTPEYVEKFKKYLGDRAIWLRVQSEKDIKAATTILEYFDGKISSGIEVEGEHMISLGRKVAVALHESGLKTPIHLHFLTSSEVSDETLLLKASTEVGALLCDGIGDSVEISTRQTLEWNHRLAFNILQASRLRMTKTEFISCPSCGRTLFDLQETTARIREQTGHLKGLKIAIMGCIVNGPGEMADADFGYVGSGPGFINLYVGKECVKRHIPQLEADQTLIDLIKEHGKWYDAPA